MWIILIKYDFDNDVLIFSSFEEAEERYEKEKKVGIQVFLTEVIRSNI